MKPRRRTTDEGQVGLGTAAALAATVLAVTAASQGLVEPGALLQTTEDLGDDLQRLGQEAADRFTPHLDVLGVVGRAAGEPRALESLNVTLRVPSNIEGNDLRRLLVRVADNERERWIAPGAFGVEALRDEDRSLAADPPWAGRGDLFLAHLDLRPGASDFTLPPRSEFRLELHTEAGPPIVLRLTTPHTYGGASVVTLK